MIATPLPRDSTEVATSGARVVARGCPAPITSLGIFTAIVIALRLLTGSSLAEEIPRPVAAPVISVPDDVAVRSATIMSEGTRMAAKIYAPKAAAGKLPTIVMAYGWGGTMERLRTEAVTFASAGYLVVTFDYRGWGESDSRVILAAPEPADRPGSRFTAEVIELREILDPLAEVEDLANVVHWLQAEPQSDTSRIGIWGSFGGGVAAVVAGYDHRIKALHAQVVPLELRALDRLGYADGTKRARGELGYPEPGQVAVAGLRGAPIAEHFLRYSPAQALSLAPDCAIQIVLAGKEELFDVNPVIAAYESLKAARKNLVIIPDAGHYDIYGKARDDARQLACVVQHQPEAVMSSLSTVGP